MAEPQPAPHEYKLMLTGDGRRIEFRAATIGHALAQALALVPHGCAASIHEDGKIVGELDPSSRRWRLAHGPGLTS